MSPDPAPRRRASPLGLWLLATHLAVLALPWIALLATGALGWDLVLQTRAELVGQARLAALLVAESDDPAGVVREVARITGAEVHLLDPRGRLVVSSVEPPPALDWPSMPEFRQALGVRVDRSRPPPPWRGGQPVHVGEPVLRDGRIRGVLVLSRTPRREFQALLHMAPRLASGLALALAVTLVLGLLAARRFGRELAAIAAASRLLAEGNLSARGALEPARRSRVREVRELARAMGSLADRLQDRLAYIREFAGNVSHEFKTPIASLRGVVELLRDVPDMEPAQRERFLANALADLERMQRLVGGLLALARAEEGSRRETVSLQAVLDRLAPAFPGVLFEGRAGAVHGDPAALEDAVRNLVVNAIEHGGRVRVRAFRVGAGLHARTGVEVEDDGPGVPPEHLERIWERFFTTRREEGGTGVGLALVRAVARAHGGWATVRSRPGETVFRLDLPEARGQREG